MFVDVLVSALCFCICGCDLLLDLNWKDALYFLELSNSPGDGRLWFEGVVAYARTARCRSSPPSMAFVETVLYGCTKHSACPLDCVFVGHVTMCCIPHVLVKSQISCDVNCVPLSETIHLGMPISVKISFKCLITLNE